MPSSHAKGTMKQTITIDNDEEMDLLNLIFFYYLVSTSLIITTTAQSPSLPCILSFHICDNIQRNQSRNHIRKLAKYFHLINIHVHAVIIDFYFESVNVCYETYQPNLKFSGAMYVPLISSHFSFSPIVVITVRALLVNRYVDTYLSLVVINVKWNVTTELSLLVR